MKTKLGSNTTYGEKIDPFLLDFIPRELSRSSITNCNFYDDSIEGSDVWHAYEFSWLDNDGSPESGILRIAVSSRTTHISESKSLKLYLGGYAFERFAYPQAVCDRIQHDLAAGLYGGKIASKVGAAAGILPIVTLYSLNASDLNRTMPKGYCVDIHTLRNPEFGESNKSFLETGNDAREEILYSHNFRSLCPVTAQPDWATVLVMYKGPEIIPESLHRYLVSYRRHQGFHEACCEQIYADILEKCHPEELGVICAFTRRGGIDITPMRSNSVGNKLMFFRTVRQ